MKQRIFAVLASLDPRLLLGLMILNQHRRSPGSAGEAVEV